MITPNSGIFKAHKSLVSFHIEKGGHVSQGPNGDASTPDFTDASPFCLLQLSPSTNSFIYFN